MIASPIAASAAATVRISMVNTCPTISPEKIENEIKLIFTDNKINSILDVAIEETDSAQIRDMGKVMAFLKDNYSGQMDFGKVSVMLKDKLKS